MSKLLAVFVLLAVGLAGCNVIQKPDIQAALGQRYLEDIRTGNFAEVLAALSPQLNAAYAEPALLQQIHDGFPKDKPKAITLVGWQTTVFKTVSGPGTTKYSLTYQYDFPHIWMAARVEMVETGGKTMINGLYLYPHAEEAYQANAFTLSGKSPLHYLFLFLAPALALFTTVTAVFCWRTPIPKRKWLWIIFVLLGFVTLSLNWSTGNVSVSLFYFSLLSGGFSKAEGGPLILQIAIPLGAIIFWIRRNQWVRTARENAVAQF